MLSKPWNDAGCDPTLGYHILYGYGNKIFRGGPIKPEPWASTDTLSGNRHRVTV